MGTTSYVSISLATALERSLDLAAHNMANASTAGYKAQHPLLEAVAGWPGMVAQSGVCTDFRKIVI